MAEAVTVRGLSVLRGPRAVLREVDFGAPEGAVSVVLGPNGAGKSTLLKSMAGLLAYRGEICVGDVEISTLSPRARARRVAYVPQQTELRAPLLVREVVALGCYARGGAHARAENGLSAVVEDAMQTTDVAALAARKFTELSGGEQRRVLIARALATGAPLLLLDEPAASLDIQHALALFSLCRALAAQGRSVVMVLHPLADALRFADHVLLLHQGSAVAAGSPISVLLPSRVREVYGVHMIPESAPSFERADQLTEGGR
jgi:iron complex transport system ATP-binding protein